MKGKVEATIPQRQFENIRMTYEFNNDLERVEAINKTIDDCIHFNNIVGKKAVDKAKREIAKKKTKVDPSDEITSIGGVDWRQRGDKWQYFDRAKRQWTEGSLENAKA